MWSLRRLSKTPKTMHKKKVSLLGLTFFLCIHYKPSSVPLARPLSFIYYDNHLPSLATYPPTLDEQPLIVGIHGLATHETYCRGVLLPSRWALTPPSHPYPYGRLFSSTLLYPHGYQAVNLRGALCCSDFPLPPKVSAIERVCGRKGTNLVVKSNKKGG